MWEATPPETLMYPVTGRAKVTIKLLEMSLFLVFSCLCSPKARSWRLDLQKLRKVEK